jgi:alkanesulfonate monooxygenase SsuD/methylene tetrahydromethanopterin reductase-like flavin-dependent oxidoreductase (luciferase family)
MKVGISITPGANAPGRVERAEAAGFDTAIFVDSPMIFGDPYVWMAASAVRTKRIRLMPGVTNPVIRNAAITASTLAALNMLAPDRVAMGIGVGFTGTGAMGLRPATLAHLEQYVVEVRGLLRGDATEITMGQVSVPMQFLNDGPPFFRTFERLPVYMASAGPRSLELAGRIADGVILGGVIDTALVSACRDYINRGVAASGRSAQDVSLAVTPRVFLTDESGAGFEQLREALGARVLGPASNFSRIAELSEAVSPSLTRAFVAARSAAYSPSDEPDDADPRTRHLRAYRGYTSKLQPWQYDLVTPEVLEATALAGTPAMCLARLRILAAGGVSMAILSPASEQIDQVIEVFGREVIPHLDHD